MVSLLPSPTHQLCSIGNCHDVCVVEGGNTIMTKTGALRHQFNSSGCCSNFSIVCSACAFQTVSFQDPGMKFARVGEVGLKPFESKLSPSASSSPSCCSSSPSSSPSRASSSPSCSSSCFFLPFPFLHVCGLYGARYPCRHDYMKPRWQHTNILLRVCQSICIRRELFSQPRGPSLQEAETINRTSQHPKVS